MLEFLASLRLRPGEPFLISRKIYSLDILPPRRRELVEIVRDTEWFLWTFYTAVFACQPRLLSYDLSKLISADT